MDAPPRHHHLSRLPHHGHGDGPGQRADDRQGHERMAQEARPPRPVGGQELLPRRRPADALAQDTRYGQQPARPGRASLDPRRRAMIGPMTGADDLILDGSKIKWYPDRVAAWERGERIAPITVDMALYPRNRCNFNCGYCYAEVAGQHNVGPGLDRRTIMDFLDDAAEIGVKGVSFVSDGESSHH